MPEKFGLPTLLLVSDSSSLHHWVKKYLEGKFFVLIGTTKAEALKKVKETDIDLILLDAQFLEPDVFEFCESLKRMLRNTSTSIFLITGKLKKAFRIAAKKAGVTDFLSDQLNEEELAMRLSSRKSSLQTREKTADFSKKIGTPIIKKLPTDSEHS